MSRPRPECGTDAAYQRHRLAGEEACAPCKAAHAAASSAHRARNGATPRTKGPEHGTRAAYVRERRAFRAGKGPAPCDSCKAANAAHAAQQRNQTA
jgi:hypothetical protein